MNASVEAMFYAETYPFGHCFLRIIDIEVVVGEPV